MTEGNLGHGRPCPTSALDETLFEDFFVGEPEAGDVSGAEAEDVFEGAAHFAKVKIHADAFEQLDECVRTLRQRRFGTRALPGQGGRASAAWRYFKPMIRHHIDCTGSGAVSRDVQEATSFGLGRGEPHCYT